MASYNRVILMGNLTRDPELKFLQSGTAVCDVGLALNNKFKKGEEWVEEVTFVDVTLWGRTAEVAGEYLSKGSQALIEGHLKLDTWEQDGQKRSKLKVVGDKLMLVGSRQTVVDTTGQGEYSGPAPAATADVGDGDNIPF
jgi:single-strand DNA-binding protein